MKAFYVQAYLSLNVSSVEFFVPRNVQKLTLTLPHGSNN